MHLRLLVVKLISVSLITTTTTTNAPNKDIHSLMKRSVLLFPRATVLQFTVGLTVPLVLPSRSINLSLCAQINYNLPNNLTTFTHPLVIQAKSATDSGNHMMDFSRDLLYESMVGFLNTFGLPGEECLLRTVCEIAEFPMHLDHADNLLEKIVHFVFTPSLDYSADGRNFTSRGSGFRGRLLKAEERGQVRSNHSSCEGTYRRCFVSLVDLFTSKYIV